MRRHSKAQHIPGRGRKVDSIPSLRPDTPILLSEPPQLGIPRLAASSRSIRYRRPKHHHPQPTTPLPDLRIQSSTHISTAFRLSPDHHTQEKAFPRSGHEPNLSLPTQSLISPRHLLSSPRSWLEFCNFSLRLIARMPHGSEPIHL